MIKPPPPQPLSYASTSSTLASLLSSYTCYDVLGVSVKQVIFETGLPVKKALALMLQNRMVCVPLIHAESASSSSTNRYAGILTGKPGADFWETLLEPKT